jgi:hypothetical protein
MWCSPGCNEQPDHRWRLTLQVLEVFFAHGLDVTSVIAA